MNKLACFTALLLTPLTNFAFAGQDKPQPNVILINIDDLGPGLLPPYANRLKPADVEQKICKIYARKRAQEGAFDLQKHLDAAKISMPCLDSLASQGAVFNWCFSTASICAPSRCGLLTGRYQQHWGEYSIPDVQSAGIPTNVPCLAEPFKHAGYNCGMIGKWHVGIRDAALKQQAKANLNAERKLSPSAAQQSIGEIAVSLGFESSCAPGQHPLDKGFDYYFGYNTHALEYYETDGLWENHQRVPKRPPGEFLTDLFNSKAAEFVKKSLDKGCPFFLYYAPMAVHARLDPPPAKYSAPFHTGIKYSDDFYGHLRALDEGIRGIYDLLKVHQQDQNTVFILTADNGPSDSGVPPFSAPLRGGKGNGWLGGSHEPLIIYWPGHIRPIVSDELVSELDILPTALDAAGLKPPRPVDGQTLLPLLRGQTTASPHELLFGAGLHAANWSYPYFEITGRARDEKTCPMYLWGLSKTSLLMFITPTQPAIYKAFPSGRPAQTLLFDVQKDPNQTNNVYAPGHVVNQIADMIANWLRTTTPPTAIHQSDYQELMQMVGVTNRPSADANKINPADSDLDVN
jgi:uncharacterized sulfatase